MILFSSAFITQHFPSIDAQTLALHFDYDHDELGRCILYDEGKDEDKAVMDCAGDPISCEGSWNDPFKREQFLSAVSKFHGDRRQVGDHVLAGEACMNCYFALKHNNECSTHHSPPCLRTMKNQDIALSSPILIKII